MDIVHKRIPRKIEIIDTAVIESTDEGGSLHIGRIPVVGTVNEGIVQHFAFRAQEIEGQGKSSSWIIQWNQGFFVLVAVCVKEHRLHGFLVIKISARKIELLGIDGGAKEEGQKERKRFFHLIVTFCKNNAFFKRNLPIFAFC